MRYQGNIDSLFVIEDSYTRPDLPYYLPQKKDYPPIEKQLIAVVKPSKKLKKDLFYLVEFSSDGLNTITVGILNSLELGISVKEARKETKIPIKVNYDLIPESEKELLETPDQLFEQLHVKISISEYLGQSLLRRCFNL